MPNKPESLSLSVESDSQVPYAAPKMFLWFPLGLLESAPVNSSSWVVSHKRRALRRKRWVVFVLQDYFLSLLSHSLLYIFMFGRFNWICLLFHRACRDRKIPAFLVLVVG